MISIIAILCSLAAPANCHETTVTSSQVEQLTLFSCSDVASLAKWMTENHPAEYLKGWRCVLGKREERGV